MSSKPSWLAGETREWEVVESNQEFEGHVLCEQAGMKYCADWLRALSQRFRQFMAAPEPLWRPGAVARAECVVSS